MPKVQTTCGGYRNYASDLGRAADRTYSSGEVNGDDEITEVKEGIPKQIMQKKVTAAKKQVVREMPMVLKYFKGGEQFLQS